jgi:hypothetical protein
MFNYLITRQHMLDNNYTKKQIKSLIIINMLLHVGTILVAILLGAIIQILQWDKLSGIVVGPDRVVNFFLELNNVLIIACVRIYFLIILNICYVILGIDNSTSIIRFILVWYSVGIITEAINICCEIVKLIMSVNICADFCMYRFIYGMLVLINTIYIASYIKLYSKSSSIFNRIQNDESFYKYIDQDKKDDATDKKDDVDDKRFINV